MNQAPHRVAAPERLGRVNFKPNHPLAHCQRAQAAIHSGVIVGAWLFTHAPATGRALQPATAPSAIQSGSLPALRRSHAPKPEIPWLRTRRAKNWGQPCCQMRSTGRLGWLATPGFARCWSMRGMNARNSFMNTAVFQSNWPLAHSLTAQAAIK